VGWRRMAGVVTGRSFKIFWLSGVQKWPDFRPSLGEGVRSPGGGAGRGVESAGCPGPNWLRLQLPEGGSAVASQRQVWAGLVRPFGAISRKFGLAVSVEAGKSRLGGAWVFRAPVVCRAALSVVRPGVRREVA
jgi:hypothetical protein